MKSLTRKVENSKVKKVSSAGQAKIKAVTNQRVQKCGALEVFVCV